MKKYLVFLFLLVGLNAQQQKIEIYKPVTSTCPPAWLEDIKKGVKEVSIVTLFKVQHLKKQIGIPQEIQSCNTSILDEYVFEGNVPLKAIQDFFKKIPKNSLGLALPAYENEKDLKTVYVFYEGGKYEEFGRY